jgi:hypothetical protein
MVPTGTYVTTQYPRCVQPRQVQSPSHALTSARKATMGATNSTIPYSGRLKGFKDLEQLRRATDAAAYTTCAALAGV